MAELTQERSEVTSVDRVPTESTAVLTRIRGLSPQFSTNMR